MNKRINATIFLWSKEPDCSCNWIKWYVNVTDTSHSMTYHRHRHWHFLHPHAERVGRWNICVLITIQSRRKIHFFNVFYIKLSSFFLSLFILSLFRLLYVIFSSDIEYQLFFLQGAIALYEHALFVHDCQPTIWGKIIFSTFFLIC